MSIRFVARHPAGIVMPAKSADALPTIVMPDKAVVVSAKFAHLALKVGDKAFISRCGFEGVTSGIGRHCALN
jgi:hypothetical protein